MELFIWSKRRDLRERWQKQLKQAGQVTQVELSELSDLPQEVVVLLHWSALDADQQS